MGGINLILELEVDLVHPWELQSVVVLDLLVDIIESVLALDPVKMVLENSTVPVHDEAISIVLVCRHATGIV